MHLGFESLEEYLEFKIDSDRELLVKAWKQDNGQFLQRELTRIEAKVIEYVPPAFSSRELWAVNNEGSGLESIEYEEIVRSGLAEFINDQTTELPYADFAVGQTPAPVRNMAIGYKWSHQDLMKSIQAKRPLKDQKALAAKEGTEQRLNVTAWMGNQALGVKGFFSYLDKMNKIAPTNGSSGQATWISKTAPEIYLDIKKLIAASDVNTNGVFESDTLGLPVAQYRTVHDTPMSNDIMSITIAERILSTTSIKRIVKCPELKNITAKVGSISIAGQDVAIAFNSRDDVFKLQHAVEFTTLPMQVVLFNYIVPCYADTAGLFYYRTNCASFLAGV